VSRRSVIRPLAVTAIALLVAACPPAQTPRQLSGAAAPRAAVESFLGAVRAGDLQAIAEVWGDERGPARTLHDREQLEQRTYIMQRCLLHDKFRVLNELPGTGAGRAFDVELTRGDIVRTTTFTTVQGPSDRWYVREVDLQRTMDLCPREGGTPPEN
jgi:hypothetical protein